MSKRRGIINAAGDENTTKAPSFSQVRSNPIRRLSVIPMVLSKNSNSYLGYDPLNLEEQSNFLRLPTPHETPSGRLGAIDLRLKSAQRQPSTALKRSQISSFTWQMNANMEYALITLPNETANVTAVSSWSAAVDDDFPLFPVETFEDQLALVNAKLGELYAEKDRNGLGEGNQMKQKNQLANKRKNKKDKEYLEDDVQSIDHSFYGNMPDIPERASPIPTKEAAELASNTSTSPTRNTKTTKRFPLQMSFNLSRRSHRSLEEVEQRRLSIEAQCQEHFESLLKQAEDRMQFAVQARERYLSQIIPRQLWWFTIIQMFHAQLYINQEAEKYKAKKKIRLKYINAYRILDRTLTPLLIKRREKRLRAQTRLARWWRNARVKLHRNRFLKSLKIVHSVLVRWGNSNKTIQTVRSYFRMVRIAQKHIRTYLARSIARRDMWIIKYQKIELQITTTPKMIEDLSQIRREVTILSEPSTAIIASAPNTPMRPTSPLRPTSAGPPKKKKKERMSEADRIRQEGLIRLSLTRALTMSDEQLLQQCEKLGLIPVRQLTPIDITRQVCIKMIRTNRLKHMLQIGQWLLKSKEGVSDKNPPYYRIVPNRAEILDTIRNGRLKAGLPITTEMVTEFQQNGLKV